MSDPQVAFAMGYASSKHDGQVYGDGLPYTKHLGDVAAQACDWMPRYIKVIPREQRAVVLCACWLHDVMEDQGVKRQEIERLFGAEVAEIVYALTNEPGENRRVRHTLTYPKIRGNPLAVFVKLCDRIADVLQGGPLVKMYVKEHADFYAAVHTKGQFESMWAYLGSCLSRASPNE